MHRDVYSGHTYDRIVVIPDGDWVPRKVLCRPWARWQSGGDAWEYRPGRAVVFGVGDTPYIKRGDGDIGVLAAEGHVRESAGVVEEVVIAAEAIVAIVRGHSGQHRRQVPRPTAIISPLDVLILQIVYEGVVGIVRVDK